MQNLGSKGLITKHYSQINPIEMNRVASYIWKTLFSFQSFQRS